VLLEGQSPADSIGQAAQAEQAILDAAAQSGRRAMASAIDTATGAAGNGRLWNRLSVHTKQVIWAWTFLAIPILFYVGIRFYPTAQAFWLSLTDWDLLRDANFIGLANYQKLFADPVFWKVFQNTF